MRRLACPRAWPRSRCHVRLRLVLEVSTDHVREARRRRFIGHELRGALADVARQRREAITISRKRQRHAARPTSSAYCRPATARWPQSPPLKRRGTRAARAAPAVAARATRRARSRRAFAKTAPRGRRTRGPSREEPSRQPGRRRRAAAAPSDLKPRESWSMAAAPAVFARI